MLGQQNVKINCKSKYRAYNSFYVNQVCVILCLHMCLNIRFNFSRRIDIVGILNTGSPRLATGGSSVELSVGSNRYLNGDISVLSYPQPNASLTLPSGAPNILISLRVLATATNSFSITLTRSNLQWDDFGTYVLNVANQYGKRTISVNIIPISMNTLVSKHYQQNTTFNNKLSNIHNSCKHTFSVLYDRLFVQVSRSQLPRYW